MAILPCVETLLQNEAILLIRILSQQTLWMKVEGLPLSTLWLNLLTGSLSDPLSVSRDVLMNMIFFSLSHIMVLIQIIVKHMLDFPWCPKRTTTTKTLVLHFDEAGLTEAIPDFLPAAACEGRCLVMEGMH